MSFKANKMLKVVRKRPAPPRKKWKIRRNLQIYTNLIFLGMFYTKNQVSWGVLGKWLGVMGLV